MIDKENWGPVKIAVIIAILALPFGPLALALFVAGRAVVRRKKEKKDV